MSCRFATNISMLFLELPFPDHIAAARRAGFDGVEIQYPYEFSSHDLIRAARANHIAIVLINAPAGDRAQGERDLAADPRRRDDFRASIDQALAYARTIGCGQIHVLSDMVSLAYETAFACAAENLALSAEQADRFGIRILMEALNRADVPGYLLGSPVDGARLIESARRISSTPHALGLLFDAYHCQMSESDILAPLADVFHLVRHVQIADVPGRAETGSGKIDWARFRRTLIALGYEGWIGCEYRPRSDTLKGHGWRTMWALPQAQTAGGTR